MNRGQMFMALRGGTPGASPAGSGQSNSVKDRILRVSGAAHGSRCITVEKINATFKDKDSDVKVKHVARARGCGVTKGDSGGPVYKKHLAYGMLVGMNNRRPPIFGKTVCHVYYQGIGNAEELLGADVLFRR